MIIINNVVLIGRLTKDPELSFVPATGLAVTKFSLAVDKDMSKEKKEQAKAQGQPTADFINITVFGKSAENCANFLAKGRQAAVHGRISTGSYTTQTGEKRYTTDVIADRVEFIGGQATAQKQQTQHQEFTTFETDDEEDEFDIFQPVDDEDIPF